MLAVASRLDPVAAVAEAFEPEQRDLERVRLDVGQVDLDLVELVQPIERVLVGVGEVDFEAAARRSRAGRRARPAA